MDKDGEVRVVVDQREGGGGFTSDQCIQLQGQMRDYLQLASQQYVVCCCDEVPPSPLHLVISRNFTSLHHLRAKLIFTRDIRSSMLSAAATRSRPLPQTLHHAWS